MNRNTEMQERQPSLFERHLQTAIQVLIVAMILSLFTELRDIGKDVASMKVMQNMMLERLVKVEVQLRETRDDQLRMRERLYGQERSRQ